MKKDVKVGDKIYVDTHLYISHGSDVVVGGLATVTKVTTGISGGKECLFVEVKEHPNSEYNWTQFLSKEQEKLKVRFGDQIAYPDPDVDTPWIEEGDFVDGEIYHGPPIW